MVGPLERIVEGIHFERIALQLFHPEPPEQLLLSAGPIPEGLPFLLLYLLPR